MPDLVEQMYCSQQINIPPNLPFILKQYAKAAIRTQPYDLLFWSAAYFRAKAENLPPPVKERIEYPPVETPSGLSPGFLKVLHKQLGGNVTVKREILHERWIGVCLKEEALNSMLKLGHFTNNITWLNFLAIAAGHLCPVLSSTMILICEIVTEEPEGGSAMIPVETFNSLYTYLARLNCGTVSIKPETSSESTDIASTGSAKKLLHDKRHFAEIKGDVARTESGFDSQAGLMVWPDIVPSEGTATHKTSPRPEHDGATSEDGLLAVDNLFRPPDTAETIIKKLCPEPLHGTETPNKPQTQDPDSTQIIFEASETSLSDAGISIEKDKLSGIQTPADNDSNVHAVRTLDDGTEYTPSFDPIHIEENDPKPSNEIEPSEGKEHEKESIETIDEKPAKDDLEKEISSLPSTKYLGTFTGLGDNLVAIDQIKPGFTESKSFTILDEDQYWENVPGIGSVISENQIKVVTEYMKHCANKQEGMVMPRNVRHFLCPNLDCPDTIIKSD